MIHFSRKTRKFNMQASIHIGEIEKNPSQSVRILGIWVDPKLKWTAHWKQLQEKASKQIGALTRVTASTWGASFIRARQVYTAVVRPALTYGAAIWHTPTKNQSRTAQGVAAKLRTIQNKCLRTVTGAYRATPISTLEVEAYVPPIDLFLDSRLAAFQARQAGSKVEQFIENSCKQIQARIRNRRGRKAAQKRTVGEYKKNWADEREKRIQERQPRQVRSEKERVLAAWKVRWQEKEAILQEQGREDTWDQVKRPPDPAILQLHTGLRKAESTVLVHLRTGRIGLCYFLKKARVPGYESDQCRCGTGKETPRHVLLDCLDEEEHREFLRESQGRRLDFKTLLDTNKEA